jgi:hypothetical protein
MDLGIPTYGESKSLDEEVYDKLRLEREILEQIAPLVIKERYLQGREWVQTEQLYQAGMRTPGESRANSPTVWEAGIAEGVRKGLFGLGELEEDQPRCRFFKEEPSISLAGNEIIMRAELCQAQRAEQAGQLPYVVTSPGAGGSTIHDPPTTDGSLLTQRGAPNTPRVEVATATRTALRLKFTVPKGKVASLMGVMNLLQMRFSRMEVTLAVDGGQLSDQEYEDKIKEAFRQMGIEIQEAN